MNVEQLKKVTNIWTLAILLILFFGMGAVLMLQLLNSPFNKIKGEVTQINFVDFPASDSAIFILLKNDPTYYRVDPYYGNQYESILDSLRIGDRVSISVPMMEYETENILTVTGEIRCGKSVLFSADYDKQKLGVVLVLLIIGEILLALLLTTFIFVWLMS